MHKGSYMFSIISHRSESDKDLLNQELTTKHSTIDEQFTNWYNILISYFKKCLYKKVIHEVKNKFQLFSYLSDFWRADLLRIKAMIKVIKHKARKYDFKSFNANDPQLKSIFQSVDTYTTNILKLLNDFQYELTTTIDDLEKIEEMIALYFQLLYTKAKFYKNAGKHLHAIALLSISLFLLKKTVKIIKSADTLNYIQKIYLCLTSYCILNKDFDSGLIYLEKSTSFSFREFFFRLDYTEGLSDLNYSRSKKRKIVKIVINITSAFYLRGVCYENLGHIKKAVESYKQCQYFTQKFLYNSFPYLAKLMKKLTERGMEYNDTISFLQNEERKMKLEEMKLRYQEELKNAIQAKSSELLKMIANGDYYDKKKFEAIIKNLDEYAIPEINMVNKFENKKQKSKTYSSINSTAKDYLLSSIRLINAYSSKEFKDYVRHTNKLNLYDFDYTQKERLQKMVNKMYYDKSIKSHYKHNANTISHRRRNMNNDATALTGSLSLFTLASGDDKKVSNTARTLTAMTSSKDPPLVVNKQLKRIPRHKKQIRLSTSNEMKNNNTTTESFLVVSSKAPSKISLQATTVTRSQRSLHTRTFSAGNGVNNVEKYPITKEIFMKSLNNKKNYLNNLSEKELNFQKKVLTLKSKEKIYIEKKKDERIEKEAEILFNTLFQLTSSNNTQHKINEKISTEEMNELRRQAYILNSIIMSQNEKALRINEMEENRNNNERIFSCEDEEMCAMMSDPKAVKNKNEEVIQRLEENINYIKYSQTQNTLQNKYSHKRNRILKGRNKPKLLALDNKMFRSYDK